MNKLLCIICIITCVGLFNTWATQGDDGRNQKIAAIDGESIQLSTVEDKRIDMHIEDIGAEVVDVNAEFDTPNNLEMMGDITYSKAIKVDEMVFYLYPTFDDLDNAVAGARKELCHLLDEMEGAYSLPVFSSKSIDLYIDHYYDYKESFWQQSDEELNDVLINEMPVFESFVDIYENYECNEDIEQMLETIDLNRIELLLNDRIEINNNLGGDDVITLNSSNYLGSNKENAIDDNDSNKEENNGNCENKENEITTIEVIDSVVEKLSDLYVMMPSNTGAAEAIDSIKETIIKDTEQLNNRTIDDLSLRNHTCIITASYNKNSEFSISQGVKYAKKYAKNPNVTKYSTCSTGDCTNFVSQIKHEGGVPRYLEYGQSGAWSYKVISGGTYPTLKYSTRWCRADSFVKFFGVKQKWKTNSYSKKRTAFIKFADSVKKGSFITFDETDDGSWDHCGFVTAAKSSATIDYHGSKYKNFKIAQHTNNYHRWVSHKKCNWETMPFGDYPKVVYAIVY